jgi:UDP-N-acetylglucosamine 4,6-dehydratase
MLLNPITYSRKTKKFIMMTIDSIIIISVLLASFSLRLDLFYWPEGDIRWLIFTSPLLSILIFLNFGLYDNLSRFFDTKSQIKFAQVISIYALVWGLIALMSNIIFLPRSVILINWGLSILSILSSRIFIAWVLNKFYSNRDLKIKKILIYGAGSAGRQLISSINQLNSYKVIGVIDDDKRLKDGIIYGSKVFHSDQLSNLIKTHQIDEVFLAIPSISRYRRNQILANLNTLNVLVRSVPSLLMLYEGKIRVDDLQEINIDELLGRDSVKPNKNLLKIKIQNKVVMVTGAGGSIGSELCRQISALNPKTLILFDISESSLYLIDQELSSIKESQIEFVSLLGSVTDRNRMKSIFNFYRVDTVYHAAAYKHVPLVESNQTQGVLNNCIGTWVSAEAAIAAKVDTFVLVSTDKAVRPTSTMGATKRVSELILQALAKQSHQTNLTMVRFGNVLNSSGSVIPLFKKQIKEGGPVTVTDSRVVRFFMTIPEAVELVIQAGAMGKGGDVFVLDMGKPILIYDLALKMIQLSGLTLQNAENPSGDIEIQFIGLRPGEKLYEELLVGQDVKKTNHKLIMTANEKMIEWDVLKPLLGELYKHSYDLETKKVHEILIKLVPEYK